MPDRHRFFARGAGPADGVKPPSYLYARFPYEQLCASLVAEATTTLTVPSRTSRCRALTVRPRSAPGTGSCSLRISLASPPRSIPVFGPTLVFTATPPTVRLAIVTEPVAAVQVDVETDWIAVALITGRPGMPMVTS